MLIDTLCLILVKWFLKINLFIKFFYISINDISFFWKKAIKQIVIKSTKVNF